MTQWTNDLGSSTSIHAKPLGNYLADGMFSWYRRLNILFTDFLKLLRNYKINIKVKNSLFILQTKSSYNLIVNEIIYIKRILHPFIVFKSDVCRRSL